MGGRQTESEGEGGRDIRHSGGADRQTVRGKEGETLDTVGGRQTERGKEGETLDTVCVCGGEGGSRQRGSRRERH